MRKSNYAKLGKLVNGPEVILMVLLFVFHFAWETLQMPFFVGMPGLLEGLLSLACLQATFGDVVIGMVAYGSAALFSGNRFWLMKPRTGTLVLYLAVGLLITIVFEWYAVYAVNRWAYSDLMPIVPGLRVGLIPLLQWMVLPPVVLALASRHFARKLPARAATLPARAD